MANQITTTTGTMTQPIVKAQVSDGGSGVSINDAGDTDFDSRVGLATDFNLFQELNDFIRVVAAGTGQAAPAVIVQLQTMLADMRRNPLTRPPVYTP